MTLQINDGQQNTVERNSLAHNTAKATFKSLTGRPDSAQTDTATAGQHSRGSTTRLLRSTIDAKTVAQTVRIDSNNNCSSLSTAAGNDTDTTTGQMGLPASSSTGEPPLCNGSASIAEKNSDQLMSPESAVETDATIDTVATISADDERSQSNTPSEPDGRVSPGATTAAAVNVNTTGTPDSGVSDRRPSAQAVLMTLAVGKGPPRHTRTTPDGRLRGPRTTTRHRTAKRRGVPTAYNHVAGPMAVDANGRSETVTSRSDRHTYTTVQPGNVELHRVAQDLRFPSATQVDATTATAATVNDV